MERNTNEIMVVKDVAELLRIHPSTIYRMLKQKKIPAFRMGSDWRFNRDQINKWLLNNGKI